MKAFREILNSSREAGFGIEVGAIFGCGCGTFIIAIGASFIGLFYLAKIALF